MPVVVVAVVFLLLGCHSWCPLEAAESHRGELLQGVGPCPQLGQGLGSGSRDSCASKAAEAARPGEVLAAGRYFGPGLPPPAPVSLGSLVGGGPEEGEWVQVGVAWRGEA